MRGVVDVPVCCRGLRSGTKQVLSVTQTTGRRHVHHEDDILLGLSQLGLLRRMAPQPHMMSDLCSSHQSVTTQTVQQLYNCGFSISVLTGTKSPHLLWSESDLLTTHDQLRRHN